MLKYLPKCHGRSIEFDARFHFESRAMLASHNHILSIQMKGAYRLYNFSNDII